MKIPLAGTLLLTAFLATGCDTSWDDTPHTAIIQGWVTNADDGLPVAGARVCAERPSDESTSCTRSEETEGFYRIFASWRSNKDRYIRVTAVREGFRPYQRRVQTLDLETVGQEPIPSLPYVLNIRLYPEN